MPLFGFNAERMAAEMWNAQRRRWLNRCCRKRIHFDRLRALSWSTTPSRVEQALGRDCDGNP
jgi:hypothetical protein